MSPSAPPRGELHPPAEQARRAHYGDFYGLRPLPGDGRPVVVVWGNCQAESLRVLLESAPGAGYTVRVPPVHEITADDLPHVARLMEAADVLVSQPVAADWRGLPLGTEQVAGLARRPPQLVRFPVIRYAGLYPYQVIVRIPGGAEPPVVPYHDLRTLTEAAGARLDDTRPRPAVYRAVAKQSVTQLRDRERRHGTVVVSDLLAPAAADAAHTVNHPGNPVLTGLARRVQEAAGWPVEVVPPGRTLLRSVYAPQRPDVLDALGLDAPGRPDWLVDGRTVADEEIRAAHLAWYAEHPGAVTAGLRRHQDVLRLLTRP